MTPLESVAAWASPVRPNDIPASQHRLARLRLLDTLGLIAAASVEPVCRSVLKWAKPYTGAGRSTIVIDGTRAPAAIAALLHGTLADARDFDDNFPDSVIHPGSVVVPAALAAGEEIDVGWAEAGAAGVLRGAVVAR